MLKRSSLSLICAGLFLLSYAPPSSAQCLQEVQKGVQTTAWQQLKNYFGSLIPTDQANRNLSRLIHMKAAIVEYESAKQRIVEIVDAYVTAKASGAVVPEGLQLSTVPAAVTQIAQITSQLQSIASEGQLFAAERSFKDLVVTFDAKQLTLCDLEVAAQSQSPEIAKMQTILRELKSELTAISAAEDALGDYIKRIRT
jgi:hypothetical protein